MNKCKKLKDEVEYLPITSKTLNIIVKAICVDLPISMFKNISVNNRYDELRGILGTVIKTKLLENKFEVNGIKIIRTGFVHIPASWWDMFKNRFFPSWLLKKYPMKFKLMSYQYEQTINGIFHNMCPHIHIQDKQTHYEFLTTLNKDYNKFDLGGKVWNPGERK